ncbi:fumarylacetoacetate hydrolase family protein [uncultured Jannaschia sp.]|uniref:fumarylacetoacetate hydrolase family protein n=1 Tax=uncultured Jannaschia sp. TaxID=293347 RepID=UPI002621E437|nr:fumarylacetoacetate hydrolase family protein [uncultured Jannaschia sp.]
MKLATFVHDGVERPGVVVGDRIVPTTDASLLALIQAGPTAVTQARRLAEASATDAGYRLADISLRAPIPVPPRNVFCVGRNYKLHIEEGARARGVAAEYPPVPEFFTKATHAVCGPDDVVRLPAITKKLDYEVELAFVVGKGGRDIKAQDAAEHILGYVVLNDVTARDLQKGHGQWFKGKSLDNTCPIGPWIVTSDEFDVTADHRIWLSVNGKMRQDSLTTDMVFDCAAILESLSAGLTLEPGDIVTTGTPSGVGLGLEPQVWLRDGDVMEAGIDGIGSITNTIRSV